MFDIGSITITRYSGDRLFCEVWDYAVLDEKIKLRHYHTAKRATKRHTWMVMTFWRHFDNRKGIPRESVPPVDQDQVRAAFKAQIDKMPFS
jgi:hypothetical protein